MESAPPHLDSGCRNPVLSGVPIHHSCTGTVEQARPRSGSDCSFRSIIALLHLAAGNGGPLLRQLGAHVGVPARRAVTTRVLTKASPRHCVHFLRFGTHCDWRLDCSARARHPLPGLARARADVSDGSVDPNAEVLGICERFRKPACRPDRQDVVFDLHLALAHRCFCRLCLA